MFELPVLSGRLPGILSDGTQRFSWRRAAAGLCAVMAAVSLAGFCTRTMGQVEKPAGKQQSATGKDQVDQFPQAIAVANKLIQAK